MCTYIQYIPYAMCQMLQTTCFIRYATCCMAQLTDVASVVQHIINSMCYMLHSTPYMECVICDLSSVVYRWVIVWNLIQHVTHTIEHRAYCPKYLAHMIWNAAHAAYSIRYIICSIYIYIYKVSLQYLAYTAFYRAPDIEQMTDCIMYIISDTCI